MKDKYINKILNTWLKRYSFTELLGECILYVEVMEENVIYFELDKWALKAGT